jgi:hypothetical protein
VSSRAPNILRRRPPRATSPADEAAHRQHLDHEQPQHAAQDVGARRQREPGQPEPDQEEERLGDGDGGLGDDDRGHALLVLDVAPDEPRLGGLAADGADGGHDVERLAGQAGPVQPPERRPVAREREAPAQRVHGGDDRVGHANEHELPPGEAAQRLQDGLGPDAIDEHAEQGGAEHEEDGLDRAHR